MRGERVRPAGQVWMRCRRGLLASSLLAAHVALFAGSATAQVSWVGTTSNDWTDGTNWSSGAVPPAGTVVNIDTISPNPTVLGVGGAAAGTTAAFNVGSIAGATGHLIIQSGSTLTSTDLTRIGIAPGSTGIVTVTGQGSQWNIATP